jgi:hypothetical protein
VARIDLPVFVCVFVFKFLNLGQFWLPSDSLPFFHTYTIRYNLPTNIYTPFEFPRISLHLSFFFNQQNCQAPQREIRTLHQVSFKKRYTTRLVQYPESRLKKIRPTVSFSLQRGGRIPQKCNTVRVRERWSEKGGR